jgi:hypothetical protein
MPNNEIKDLLDDIIDDTNKSYPERNKAKLLDPEEDDDFDTKGRITGSNPQTFDKGEFKEKLSLYVLSDIVHAMMHDETKDLDGMIDDSIIKHIHDDYHGTCYSYLCDAGKRLNSPFIKDIVQEMDEVTDDVNEQLEETKDPAIETDFDMDNVLKNVNNYDELRIKLKDAVSKKVVDDVSNVITKSNDAPVFDDLDEKMENIDKEEQQPNASDTELPNAGDTENQENTDDMNETPDVDMSQPTPQEPASDETAVPDENQAVMNDESDITNESVILRMCGTIVTESAIEGKKLSVNDGLNLAIINYCINEMDYLFKAHPKVSIYQKYLK